MKKFQIVKPFWKLLIQLCIDRALRFYTIRGHLSVPVSSIHVFNLFIFSIHVRLLRLIVKCAGNARAVPASGCGLPQRL